MNGKALDIKDARPTPDAQVVMWVKGTNSRNQQWYLDPQGNILSALNDFALYSPSEGSSLIMRPISGDPNSQWYLDGQKITNRAGLVADISGLAGHDGASVISYRYNGGANQHWSLQYV